MYIYLVLKCFTNLLIHVQAKYDTIVFFVFRMFSKNHSPGTKTTKFSHFKKALPQPAANG